MGICSSKDLEGGSCCWELTKDMTTREQIAAAYKFASKSLSTKNATLTLTEQMCYGSAAENQLGSELQPEDPKETEPTYYGSAPEDLWSELIQPEAASRMETESDDLVPRIDPSDLEIGEEIAEGAQAHVYLAKFRGRGGEEVVVKRYKARGFVDVVQLQRRMAKVIGGHWGLCKFVGFSEDCTTGEVSVVMKAFRGDLRNLIDLRMRYLNSQMHNGEEDDAQMMVMMPFPYKLTLDMLYALVYGMAALHSTGLIHRDLKASNIFASPYDKTRPSGQKFLHSRNIPMEKVLAYDGGFVVGVGDYENSDGVVGTGFWRAPEVLRALRKKITPPYYTAVDVYGFGMLCYELLTGLIPFQGHRLSDYELVLSGQRPELPEYVSPEIALLLHKCWHMDPCKRPGWSEIRSIIFAESHREASRK